MGGGFCEKVVEGAPKEKAKEVIEKRKKEKGKKKKKKKACCRLVVAVHVPCAGDRMGETWKGAPIPYVCTVVHNCTVVHTVLMYRYVCMHIHTLYIRPRMYVQLYIRNYRCYIS